MGKKKKDKKGYGWDEEDRDEALEAEGLKRTDIDSADLELVDRDSSTPYIETYDEDTGELEGAIYLKDGSRSGKAALVKIIEEVKVEQDHDANPDSIAFNGKLDVINPSTADRLWDIDIVLKNIKATNLKSDSIKIQELGITEDDNTDSREFNIKGKAKNLLLIKEYINTLAEADDILNLNDLEADIDQLAEKTGVAKELEEEEEEEDEDYDVASESSLESFGISIDKEVSVTFSIVMKSMFEKSIRNVKVVKNLPDEFTKPIVRDTTIGVAETEGAQIIWTIDALAPETTVMCKFTCDIMVSDIEARKTGPIEVTYEASSSFAEGLGIDKFDAYSSNRFYVEIMEQDEAPGVWDCKIVFENTSEFMVQLFNADVYDPEDDKTKFVDIDPEDVPVLPSGAQWHSTKWQYESEDYPSFRKLLEFRVMPDFVTTVNGMISIGDVELSIASMIGEVNYALGEEATEKEVEERLLSVPTFKEKDVLAIHKLENNGSAPFNEVTVKHQYFNDEFQTPNPDEITLTWDGSEVEISPKAVDIEGNVLSISFTDLKDSSTGMFEPESTMEIKYPIHCVNPAKDTRFESEVTYLANTFPLSQEIEITPEVPVIEAQHIRRKFRVGKEVVAIGALGNYKIILMVENIGDMALPNMSLIDKVPDNFEYGDYEGEQPEITDEVGTDTLKWTIEELAEGEKVEFSYQIHGKGEYRPSEAQLAF